MVCNHKKLYITIKSHKKHVAKHVFLLGQLKKKDDLCSTNLKQSFLP